MREQENGALNRELADRSQRLAREKQVHEQTISRLQKESIDLQEELYLVRESSGGYAHDLEQLMETLRETQRQSARGLEERERLSAEVREREEQIYTLDAKVRQLEADGREQEREAYRQLQRSEDELRLRLEECEEESSKGMQVLQTELDFCREQVAALEVELAQTLKEKSGLAAEEARQKAATDAKLRMLDEERVAKLATKNTEIAQLTDSLRSLSERARAKETECQKTLLELESTQYTLDRLTNKLSEYEQKLRNLQILHQQELEEQRKKEAALVAARSAVGNRLWSAERDFKHLYQGFLRKLTEELPDGPLQRIAELSKGL